MGRKKINYNINVWGTSSVGLQSVVAEHSYMLFYRLGNDNQTAKETRRRVWMLRDWRGRVCMGFSLDKPNKLPDKLFDT
jgi:hypothetical protein